jgi:O-antigen/teichoic acid export membrane protein
MKPIAQNLVSVWSGEAAVRVANFAAALFIARVFGGFALGAYTACLAVITVVVMIADNGLQTFVVIELASRPFERDTIIGRAYLHKTILFAGAVGLLAAIAAALNLPIILWGIGSWVTARTVLQSYSQLQMAILKTSSKTNAIGAIQSVHSVFLFAGIGAALLSHWGIFSLLAWVTAGQLFELGLATIVVLRLGLRPSLGATPQFWRSMKKSAPFGVTSGLANLIIRTDTVVLSTLVPLSVVGTFSAPNSILLIVYVASWLLGSVLLPEMVRLAANEEGLRRYVGKWLRLLALTSIPVAIFACIAAPKFIPLLFGPSFNQSGTLASVMALACPFILLNSIYTNFAIAMSRRAVFTGVFAGAALLAVGLDFLLGRELGPGGIAAAIVIREAISLTGFWVLLSRKTSRVAQMDSSEVPLRDACPTEKPNLSGSLT